MRKIIYQTLRTLHRVFLASNSLNDAATTLGVSVDTIINHLGKTHYINEYKQLTPLTFHAMIHLWPDEHSAEEAWGDAYDQLICSVIVDLNQITMRELHQIFLYSHSLTDATRKLGIYNPTLGNHLSKTSYSTETGQQEPLTFELMKTKWPTIQSAFAYWGDAYDKPMNTTAVDLKQKAMRAIHRVILSSNSLANAARKLNVKHATLNMHLGKTNYYNEEGQQVPLTFKIMKTKWRTEESAFAYWGDAYDQPMNIAAVGLKQKTMRMIHRIILSSNSLYDAAAKLGTSHITLILHLSKANYTDELNQKIQLTFQIMKAQWPTEESAFAYWSDAYDQPINTIAVDLNQKTMRELHQIIFSSKSLSDAARTLGVQNITLSMHLGKTNYLTNEGQQTHLTYQIMKTQWPTEESAFAYWGESYDQPMNTASVDLKQKTMRAIHHSILSSNSLYDAAGKLGVSQGSLSTHLSRSNYLDEFHQKIQLTFKIMKTQWQSEESAFAYWGALYDQPINTMEVDLKQKTMRAMHRTFLSSHSLTDAAGKLGVSDMTLKKHLCKTSYLKENNQQAPITFHIMKTKWPTEESAFAFWGDAYDQPMNTASVDLKQKTMRAIHQIFLSSYSLAGAATTLGVNHKTLNTYLGKKIYFNEQGQKVSLTFKMMKTLWPTEESAFAYWGDAYDQPMNTMEVNLKQKTMRAIHQIILCSNSLCDAARKLGTSHTTLSMHVGRASYLNEENQQVHLTYQLIKTQWPTEESAFAFWGDTYDRPINAEIVDLNQKTMRAIHQVFLSSTSLSDAARKLGTSHNTLSMHLGRANYSTEEGQQIHLTYQLMKTQWPTEQHAYEYWRDAYDKPMNTMDVDLNQKTMRAIHQVFLSSNSLDDAAGKLGVSHTTLNMYLGRAYYLTENNQQIHLSYQIMITQWPTEECAFAYWGDLYDQSISTIAVDLKQKTMHAIHRIILASNSHSDAAGKLGVNDITLKKHLGKTKYVNEEEQQVPLTFKIMKNKWPTEESAFIYWGNAYYQPIAPTNNDSASKKRKSCAEDPLKNSKLRFFHPEVSENEPERIYPELLVFYDV